MRILTDLYNEARERGAKPLIYAYVESDQAMRCYGKETPRVAHLDESLSPLEWSSRVLIFGDFRQSLTEDSENVYQGLFQKEMDTYTLTLDNADGYFSELLGAETFLKQRLYLVQGFDYPGFTSDDFLPLFNGIISDIALPNLQCVLMADQAILPVVPDDPVVDTTKIYALTDDGTGTMASEDFTYDELEDVFFAEESWLLTTEIIRETTLTEETIFKLVNDTYGSNRLEVGIDASDHPFIRYTTDAETATPTYTTITADFTVGLGATRLEYQWDSDKGEVIITDSKGGSYSFALTSEEVVEYNSTLSASFNAPQHITCDADDNIYVTDDSTNTVKKFSPTGSTLMTFSTGFTGTTGVAVDTSGNIWVTSQTQDKFYKFSSTGTLLNTYGASGTGDGEFDTPMGITIDSTGDILIADYLNNRIQRWTSSGAWVENYGSVGSGDGQFQRPHSLDVDADDNIYVVEYIGQRVQKFTSTGVYVSQFNGSPANTFSLPRGIHVDADGNIFIADSGNDRIQKYTSVYFHIWTYGTSGTGDGQFQLPFTLTLNSDDILYVLDRTRDNVQLFTTGLEFPSFDIRDISPTPTTQDESPTVGDSFNGSIGTVEYSAGSAPAEYSTVVFEPTFQLVNDTSATETSWEDVISSKDLLVEDGVWEEWIETETITETLEPLDTIDALEEIILPTTDRYDNPGESQQNVTLPLPYGDLTENSDVGVYAAPCIDSIAHVYCVSVKPILSVANGNTVKVYVDGVLQTSGYTFDESNDYQSQGEIALIDFASDPGGVVTVSCSGVDDGVGNLLTNPVDILEDFLGFAATLTGGAAWQKDIGSFANTKAMAASYNYTCAGVMQSNNSLGYWVKVVLKSFLGSYQFDSQGRISISILPNVQSENIIETIDEYEAITVSAKQTRKNLCRRVLLNYAVTFADVDKRFKNGGESAYFRTYDEQGTNTLGEIWNLDLDWTRNTATVENITSVLLALYGDQQWAVSYQGQDFKFLPIDLLDQVTGTFFLLKDSDGIPREDLIFEIREKTVNLDSFTTTLQLKSINFVLNDTNRYVYLGSSQITLGGVPITLG